MKKEDVLHYYKNSVDKDGALSLRRITSLTDDEKVKWYDLSGEGVGYTALGKIEAVNRRINFNTFGYSDKRDQRSLFNVDEFHYLLSIGIDLFNLIDTNQAIEHNIDNG